MKLTRLHLYMLAFLFTACISCNLVVVNQHPWEEQGPGPITNGQCEGIPDRPVSGAISSVLPDPEDANIIIIGSVNGGIWKTENALDNHPAWIPINDHLPSLSISCMFRDQHNPNIIYAGLGNVSSTFLAGPLLGILKSTDRGLTWNLIDSDSLKNNPILKIGVGLYNNSDVGSSIYVATELGLFKSTDGIIFSKIQTIRRAVTDLFVDPKGQYVVAACPGDSVYFSDDYGVTFMALNLDVSNAWSLRVSMAPSHKLFIAESRLDTSLAFIYMVDLSDPSSIKSLSGPVTYEDFWFTNKGPFNRPQQSYHHFSFISRQIESAHIDLFLGGVANSNKPGSTLQLTASGRIFHGIYNMHTGNLEWSAVVGIGANLTAPHADSRCLAFDKNEDLIEVDDGGIYKLTSPFLKTPETKWSSLNGNLRISEVYSVSYDARNNAIIAGLQDCGSVEQLVDVFSTAEKKWTDSKLFTLGFDLGNATGDGFSVNVDNQHNPSVRYTMLNNIGRMHKREYTEINPGYVGAPWDHFLFNNNCLFTNCALDSFDRLDLDGETPIVGMIPFELNAVQNKKFVLGAKAIYRLDNLGNDLLIVDTLKRRRNTQCIAYGSRDLEDVIYYIKSSDTIINQLIDTSQDWTRKTFKGLMMDIAIDPDSGNNIFLVTRDSVFHLRDFSGSTVSENLTLNLHDLLLKPSSISNISVFTVEIENSPQRIILVGACSGVFILTKYKESLSWIKLGTGMPNVPVTEMRYFKQDDILVVGTIGRGVWVMKDFSQKIPKKVMAPLSLQF